MSELSRGVHYGKATNPNVKFYKNFPCVESKHLLLALLLEFGLTLYLVFLQQPVPVLGNQICSVKRLESNHENILG